MACHFPLRAWQASDGSITFGSEPGLLGGNAIWIDCGRCLGCRLERARQWAIRMMHESTLHEHSIFVTLTYDDFHLPPDLSLVPDDTQTWLKRLRKLTYPSRIRFYLCGEYGDLKKRPHYHAVLFGWWPSDAVPTADSQGGYPQFVSALLDLSWGKGLCTFSYLTFESAAYTAGYIVDKVMSKDVERLKAHYGDRHPEFSRMSRRPGIGAGWEEKYSSETWRDDYIVINGRKMRPPLAYLRRLEKRGETIQAQNIRLDRDEHRIDLSKKESDTLRKANRSKLIKKFIERNAQKGKL